MLVLARKVRVSMTASTLVFCWAASSIEAEPETVLKRPMPFESGML